MRTISLSIFPDATAVYSEFSLSRNAVCLKVRFKNTAKSYLDFLTLYENAPTSVVSQIEDGLGRSGDPAEQVPDRSSPQAPGQKRV